MEFDPPHALSNPKVRSFRPAFPGLPLSLEAVLGLIYQAAKCASDLRGTRLQEAAHCRDRRSSCRLARMVHTMIKIADEPGDGTAADRTVRLKAALAVLGEEAKGVSVNVQVNNQTNLAQTIRPGYVLDLGAMYGRRHDDDGLSSKANLNDRVGRDHFGLSCG
jgi:hypothetical protein